MNPELNFCWAHLDHGPPKAIHLGYLVFLNSITYLKKEILGVVFLFLSAHPSAIQERPRVFITTRAGAKVWGYAVARRPIGEDSLANRRTSKVTMEASETYLN